MNYFKLSCVTSLLVITMMSHLNAITIGTSAAYTGPSQSLGQNLNQTAKLYFEYINAQGGIHGQALRTISYDDHYDPTPVIYNTHRLIFDDNVDLLFGYVGTPTVVRILPLLKIHKDRQLLLFFPFTGAMAPRTPPYNEFVYNLRASYQEEIETLISHLVANGFHRFAIFYQCDAYGRNGWEITEKALAKHQLRLIKEATYKRGSKFQDSYKAQVKILKSAKPDVIIMISVYAPSAGFIRDARNSGLTIPLTNLSFVSATDVAQLLTKLELKEKKNYTQSLIFSQVVPNYQDLSIPAVKSYYELIKGSKKSPSYVGFEGYLNAKLMVEILKLVPPPFSKEKLALTLSTPHQFKLGIDQTVTLGGTHHQGLSQVYFTTISNNQFSTIQDWSSWRK